MPTVTFPLSYLRRLAHMPLAEIEAQAFNYGLEVSLGELDLDVEVTAERPDLLAAEGFMRAMNIYSGQPRLVSDTLADSGYRVTVEPAVLGLRPYLAALVVRQAHLQDGGLEVLMQFQEKVTQTFGRQRKKIAIGIYDLDGLTGHLTYTARPKTDLTFVPLGETAPITAADILDHHPAGQLYGSTLPAGEMVPVLHDAEGQILSMPPIINAAGVGEISATTRHLFIDITGILPQTVQETANLLAHNFLDTGAEVQTVTVTTPTGTHITPSLARRAVPFSARFLNEIMGSAIPKAKLGQVLARMDLTVSGTHEVYVPTYRTDLLSQVDLAGDLMVALGLDHFQAEPLSVKFHLGQADDLRQFVFRVGDLSQRLGLMEVKGHVLTDPTLLDWFADQYLQTSNAKSRTYSATRTTLQVGLLEVLSRNIQAPKPINLYETGEVLRLTAAGEGAESQAWGFASLDARASFSTAKAYIQTLLRALGITYTLTAGHQPYYIPGRSAQVQVEGETIGEFGEIHPRLLNRFSFPEPIAMGELNLSQIYRLTP
ncbi:phenylalanine--tRNA ligase subunit beta [Leptolyngbya sp. BL0902]|uniref:phenylalanine--tRNA ligase subunit beta n=1 Tax=Leptolyngbya sp. BL0902 TaxID=1115757 RepID=UPI0018E72569|nr:phenylalanine--tRNA ligase subunit beta [Leptolyngbya sp. BL0902]QQE63340.1 phenylalanine--tRNA ligase subunit beta [Leptolyngbya sp. BL0902]